MEVDPIETALPIQSPVLAITLAAGNGFTVMVTELDLVQPVASLVSVSVYMVVMVGLTVGLEDVDPKPEGLLVQEYEWPEIEVAPIDIELPEQILLLAIVVAEGSGYALILIVDESFT